MGVKINPFWFLDFGFWIGGLPMGGFGSHHEAKISTTDSADSTDFFVGECMGS